MAQTHIHYDLIWLYLNRFISLHYFLHYNASNEFWHLRLTCFDICSKNCNFDICGRRVMTFAVNQILTFAGIMTFAGLWHLRLTCYDIWGNYDICGWRVMTFAGILTLVGDFDICGLYRVLQKKNQGVRSTPWKFSWTPKGLKFRRKGSKMWERAQHSFFSFSFLLVREVGNVGSSIGIPTLCVEIWPKEIWGRNINVSKFFAVNSDYV